MIKKILIAISTICLFSAIFVISASASADNFSVSDARKNLVAIANESDMTQLSDYDFNKDEKVTLSDVRIMLNLISNGYNNANQKYTLAFDNGGGVGDMETMSSICGLSIQIPENQFTNNNLFFYRWTAARNSDGYVYCSNSKSFEWYDPQNIPDGYNIVNFKDRDKMFILTEDGDEISLKASWKKGFYVVYDANGGEGTTNSQTAYYGESNTLNKNTFANYGHDFFGWYAYRTSDNKWYYYNEKNSAGWYIEGEQPEGYHKYLYPDACAVSNTSSVAGDTVVMHAVWKKYFNVQFNSNGGEGTTNSQTAYYGESNILNKNTFTNYGHDFFGWYAYRTSDNKWYYYNRKNNAGWYIEGEQPEGYYKYLYPDACTVSKTSSVAGDTVVMHAVWKKYFNVQFNSNGGEGTTNSQTAYYGESNILNKNTFTNYGHDFSGWYAYRTSDNKWYYYNGKNNAGWYIEGEQPEGYYKYLYPDACAVSKTSSVAGDTVVMHAIWKKYYNVQFNSNGGSGSTNSQKVYYGVSTALNANKFACKYKTFAGWYAQRMSDSKWYYYNKSTGGAGWYISGTQPSGYVKYMYPDKSVVARTSNVAGDTVTMYAVWNTAFRKEVYGTSYQGRELYAYIFNDTPFATKTLFIDFAVHGFEDEYYRDGKVLVDCALKIAEYYSKDCSELGNYRLVLVPCANPDGTYAGTNDLRACSTAFGRCTAAHIDMNRDFRTFAAQESRYLRDLIKKYNPNVYVNCHGWLDMVLGNKEVGSIFVDEYSLKNTKYGVYAYSEGYIIGWVNNYIGAKSVLLEYKNSKSTDYTKMINCINKIAATVS